MIKSGIKLITFDATNTLMKFRVPPWSYYKHVCQDFGYEADEETLKRNMLSTFKLMHSMHPNFGKDSIGWEEWWCQVVKKTLENVVSKNAPLSSIALRLIDDFKTSKCWCAADGAHSLVDELTQTHGVHVGVISNFDPRLSDVLKCLNLYNKMKFVILSYDVGYCKPDRRIFEVARSRCGDLLPNECVHIGDDLRKDYEGAVAAGWRAFLVARDLEKPPARDCVFISLQQLNVKLKSLINNTS